jgi:hypothetical protein
MAELPMTSPHPNLLPAVTLQQLDQGPDLHWWSIALPRSRPTTRQSWDIQGHPEVVGHVAVYDEAVFPTFQKLETLLRVIEPLARVLEAA